jgi:hypothetical protein
MQIWRNRDTGSLLRIASIQANGVLVEVLQGTCPILGSFIPWEVSSFKQCNAFVEYDGDIFDRLISGEIFRNTPVQYSPPVPMTPMRRSVIAEIQEMEDREFLRAIREVIENRPEPKDAWILLMESHDDLLP